MQSAAFLCLRQNFSSLPRAKGDAAGRGCSLRDGAKRDGKELDYPEAGEGAKNAE